MSYVLTSLVLLSQLGLPLHIHYCKGMLESVSVYFSAACNDHEEITNLPACCATYSVTNCHKDDSCCDDEFKLLLQEFDSLLPQFDKWDNNVASINDSIYQSIYSSGASIAQITSGHNNDSGPPIYIRYNSLIFYA